jgi:hypothetical protein
MVGYDKIIYKIEGSYTFDLTIALALTGIDLPSFVPRTLRELSLLGENISGVLLLGLRFQ